MVGQAQVVVDGLGHTDEPHRAAHPRAIAAELGDGIHRVVATDVEQRTDVVLVKQGEEFNERGGVHIRVRQLVAAAAQIAGRGALEQFDAHAVVQQNVQLQHLFLEQAFDAVLHPVDLLSSQTDRGFVDACQTGIDDGCGAAALANDDVFRHENLLLIQKNCYVPQNGRLRFETVPGALHCSRNKRSHSPQVVQKECRMCKHFNENGTIPAALLL